MLGLQIPTTMHISHIRKDGGSTNKTACLPCKGLSKINDMYKGTGFARVSVDFMIDQANNSVLEWATHVTAKFSGNSFTTNATYSMGMPQAYYSTEFDEQFWYNPATSEIVTNIVHTHPTGTGNIYCLSVKDIWCLKEFVDFYFETYSTTERKNFLENNASITAISANYTYIATINDWQGLRTFFDTHNVDAVRANFLTNYEDYGYSGESALLKEFGGLINLYKSPTSNSSNFKQITPSGTNPKIYNSTPCY